MALSDKSQMRLMKRDKPTMSQKAPPTVDVCYPKEHKAKPLSDKAQYSQMKKRGR